MLFLVGLAGAVYGVTAVPQLQAAGFMPAVG